MLQDILDLAGPDFAPTLMQQIRADVTKVRDELATNLPTTDHTAIRSASHVLIALAGTIGAPQLREKAITLNTAAHSGDRATLDCLGATILSELQALLHDLAARAQHMASGGAA